MKCFSTKVAAVMLTVAGIAGIASLSNVSAGSINPGLTITADSGINFTWGSSIGYQFTVNSNVSVNALGMFTDGGTVGGPEQVGLWDTAGNLLASTSVQPGDPVVGLFQYDFISPVALSAGSSYLVAGVGNYTFGEGFVTDPRITYTNDVWADNGQGLVFPNLVEGTPGGFPGGTVSLSAVPEPGSVALVGLGMVCLAGFAWRRRQKAAV
jgi:hypothetical protein